MRSSRSAAVTLCCSHALLQSRSAAVTLCCNHALLQSRSAAVTLCCSLNLLQSQSAAVTLCCSHTLLQSHSAAVTLCCSHTLLQSHSAAVTLCCRICNSCHKSQHELVHNASCSKGKRVRTSRARAVLPHCTTVLYVNGTGRYKKCLHKLKQPTQATHLPRTCRAAALHNSAVR